MKFRPLLSLPIVLWLPVCPTYAETMQECLSLAVQSAAADVTVGELRALCEQRRDAARSETPPPQAPLLQQERIAPTTTEPVAIAEASGEQGLVRQRLALERYSRDNPFVLTPHRANYVMPIVYLKDPNEKVFADRTQEDFDFQHIEFQFQLSLKSIVWDDILGDNSYLAFAYTNRSFWQAYNSDISAPFRETNHEPEVLLTFENDWQLFGFNNVANQFGLNHQSNGRAGNESRSWNRLTFNAILERDNVVMSFRPWYRIPESGETDPDDPSGDDNPDIEYYMGNFEWFAAWQRQQSTYSVLLRNNLRSDNKGAVELGWSFPLGGRFRGYIKYFNGYGESLIDYNDSTESLGVGVLISDWL